MTDASWTNPLFSYNEFSASESANSSRISWSAPYRRPVPAEVMASYRRYHLRHLTQEFCSFLERLYSPTLPEQPLLLSHIVQTPLTHSSSTQTPLPPILVDQRTQTDGCPHAEPCCPRLTTPASPPRISSPPFAYIHPLSPSLASSPSNSEPGSPGFVPCSPSRRPGSPNYTPTSPRPDMSGYHYYYIIIFLYYLQ
ncbi:DNA-directed RNA polymerase II subunit RPB1-like [Tachysurus fulvidraco]|uniref:DNA-directed RNA polymerase II subunit RPB1-like n=1 Tax=Tachysurus fulvidraco TaxID=1234273 RepID=UPI001FEF4189|nr:DNA-directed RNA polymerase II subunit RPB1-like [Tachysurus fulvidraco]